LKASFTKSARNQNTLDQNPAHPAVRRAPMTVCWFTHVNGRLRKMLSKAWSACITVYIRDMHRARDCSHQEASARRIFTQRFNGFGPTQSTENQLFANTVIMIIVPAKTTMTSLSLSSSRTNLTRACDSSCVIRLIGSSSTHS